MSNFQGGSRLSLAVEAHVATLFEEQQHRLIEEKVRSALQQLDYVVLDDDGPAALAKTLNTAKMALVDCKYPDYKLLLRLGKNDTLSLRLVRVVDSVHDKQNISDHQRQRDHEVKEEWCKNADLFRDLLAESGVLTVQKLRVEDDVHYFTVEELEQQALDTSSVRKKKSPSTRKQTEIAKKPG